MSNGVPKKCPINVAPYGAGQTARYEMEQVSLIFDGPLQIAQPKRQQPNIMTLNLSVVYYEDKSIDTWFSLDYTAGLLIGQKL